MSHLSAAHGAIVECAYSLANGDNLHLAADVMVNKRDRSNFKYGLSFCRSGANKGPIQGRLGILLEDAKCGGVAQIAESSWGKLLMFGSIAENAEGGKNRIFNAVDPAADQISLFALMTDHNLNVEKQFGNGGVLKIPSQDHDATAASFVGEHQLYLVSSPKVKIGHRLERSVRVMRLQNRSDAWKYDESFGNRGLWTFSIAEFLGALPDGEKFEKSPMLDLKINSVYVENSKVFHLAGFLQANWTRDTDHLNPFSPEDHKIVVFALRVENEKISYIKSKILADTHSSDLIATHFADSHQQLIVPIAKFRRKPKRNKTIVAKSEIHAFHINDTKDLYQNPKYLELDDEVFPDTLQVRGDGIHVVGMAATGWKVKDFWINPYTLELFGLGYIRNRMRMRSHYEISSSGELQPLK